MTKSAQEILAEWADPETGGTMPKEVREAALSVLRLVAEWNQPTPESEWQKMCNRALRAEARVKELEKCLRTILDNHGLWLHPGEEGCSACELRTAVDAVLEP